MSLPVLVILSVIVGLVVGIVMDWILSKIQIVIRNHYGVEYYMTPQSIHVHGVAIIGAGSALLTFLELVYFH